MSPRYSPPPSATLSSSSPPVSPSPREKRYPSAGVPTCPKTRSRLTPSHVGWAWYHNPQSLGLQGCSPAGWGSSALSKRGRACVGREMLFRSDIVMCSSHGSTVWRLWWSFRMGMAIRKLGVWVISSASWEEGPGLDGTSEGGRPTAVFFARHVYHSQRNHRGALSTSGDRRHYSRLVAGAAAGRGAGKEVAAYARHRSRPVNR